VFISRPVLTRENHLFKQPVFEWIIPVKKPVPIPPCVAEKRNRFLCVPPQSRPMDHIPLYHLGKQVPSPKRHAFYVNATPSFSFRRAQLTAQPPTLSIELALDTPPSHQIGPFPHRAVDPVKVLSKLPVTLFLTKERASCGHCGRTYLPPNAP